MSGIKGHCNRPKRKVKKTDRKYRNTAAERLLKMARKREKLQKRLSTANGAKKKKLKRKLANLGVG